MTERHYYDSLDQKVNHLTLQRPESLYNGEGQHADAHHYQSQQQLPHQEWEQRSNDRYSERPMTNAVKQNLWVATKTRKTGISNSASSLTARNCALR